MSKEGIWTLWGALAGGLVGLLGAMAGAFLTAHLGRKRDKRIEDQEKRVLATVLREELLHMQGRFKWRRNALEISFKEGTPNPKWDWTLPPREIFNANRERLGMLDAETVSKVVNTYGLIKEYETAFRLSDRKPETAKWASDQLEKMSKTCGETARALNKIAGSNEVSTEKIVDKGRQIETDLNQTKPCE